MTQKTVGSMDIEVWKIMYNYIQTYISNYKYWKLLTKCQNVFSISKWHEIFATESVLNGIGQNLSLEISSW